VIKQHNARYFSFEESPISLAESSSGAVFMQIMLKNTLSDIMKRLNLNELIHMIDINSCNVDFFNKLVAVEPAAFADKEYLKPGSHEKPYTTVSDLNILTCKSTEVLRDEVGAKLFDKNIAEEWKKPVMTHVTLCKFPLVTGSAESREFHTALYYCEDVKIFESASIENFVKYKAGDAINYFYIYSLPYIIYMLFLTWINPQSVFTIAIFLGI
jgi:hypothetical protein